MNNLKISIIVPIYNVEEYLERCIVSIINQTYKNLEIILVDDGSPDNSAIICENYAKKDERIIVVHKKNGGLSAARNSGLKISTGDYVLFVDSDDFIELDSCEKLIHDITDDIDIVVGVCKEIRSSDIFFQKHSNLVNGQVYKSKDYVLLSIEKNEWYAPAWLNLYKRKFLVDNNLYYRDGYYFEDLEMLPRLFLSNPTIKYINYPFYNYIIRENSIMTSGFTPEKIEMILNIYSDWYKYFNTLNDEELKNKLFGILVRYYLSAARRMKVTGWRIDKIDFKFSIRYALTLREKFKILLFNFFPHIYVNFLRKNIR